MSYKIKLLKWVRAEEEVKEHDDIQDKYIATTPFGSYEIELIGLGWYVREAFDRGCIGRESSLEAAQELATNAWEIRLGRTLLKEKEEEK